MCVAFSLPFSRRRLLLRTFFCGVSCLLLLYPSSQLLRCLRSARPRELEEEEKQERWEEVQEGLDPRRRRRRRPRPRQLRHLQREQLVGDNVEPRVRVALHQGRLVRGGAALPHVTRVGLRLSQVEEQVSAASAAVLGGRHLEQVVLEQRHLEADAGAAAGERHVHGHVRLPRAPTPARAGVGGVQLLRQQARVCRDHRLLDLELVLGAAVDEVGDLACRGKRRRRRRRKALHSTATYVSSRQCLK